MVLKRPKDESQENVFCHMVIPAAILKTDVIDYADWTVLGHLSTPALSHTQTTCTNSEEEEFLKGKSGCYYQQKEMASGQAQITDVHYTL